MSLFSFLFLFYFLPPAALQSDPAVHRVLQEVASSLGHIIANATDAMKEVGKCQLVMAFIFSGAGSPSPDWR